MPAPEPVRRRGQQGRPPRGGWLFPKNRIHPLRDQLAAVITYIDQFQRLDLMSVGPIAPSARGANRLDDDAPEPTLASSDLMQ
jgi:Asp-tRNA(Asn)/Glu-tRNA(Gln) amidotransferase C subunit